MSSPYRGSQSPKSSPVTRFRRSKQFSPNGFRPSSSHRESTSSPSRQLAEDLSRVYISDVKAFKLSLDLQDEEQARVHQQALIKSLAEHELIRQSAEQARQRVELEIERARRQLIAEEKRKLEEARLKIEREEQERKTREAARLKQIEDQKKAQELQKERERLEQEQKAEQQRQQRQKEKLAQEALAKQPREKEEQARKQAEIPVVTSAAVSKTTPAISNLLNGVTASTTQPGKGWKTLKPVSVLTPQGVVSTPDQRESEHQRYIQMHKKLKEMRTWVSTQAKTVPGLSDQLSEMRRTIKKKLSMFNAVDKTLNRKPVG